MTFERRRTLLENLTELSLAIVSLNDKSVKKKESLYVYLYNQLFIKYSLQSESATEIAYHRALKFAKKNGISLLKEKEFVEKNFKRCQLGIRTFDAPYRADAGYAAYCRKPKDFNKNDYPF